ncbi:Basic leucine zipper 25 [Linum grandiflorum]
MHSDFSADDFTDAFWQPTSPPMDRNASEWDLERFLKEIPPFDSSSDSGSTITAPSRSPPQLTKPESDDGDVMEIKNSPQLRPLAHSDSDSVHPSQPRNHLLRSLDRPPLAAIDTDEYREILKSQLYAACAAVALTRTAAVNPPDVPPLPKDQTLAPVANSIHLGPQVPGASLGNSNAQSEVNRGSAGVLPLSVVQKKQEEQTRQTASSSSREDSDDDDLEGGTDTNEAPTDVKRARRC